MALDDHLPSIVVKARTHVQAWINQERSKYADVKFREETPNRQLIRDEFTDGQLTPRALAFAENYLTRAKLMGIDSPQGRQALGKAVVTLTHYLETACEYWGELPEPGHPSGEIRVWADCPVPLPEVAGET